jgi:hypothetical protein
MNTIIALAMLITLNLCINFNVYDDASCACQWIVLRMRVSTNTTTHF